MCGLAGFFLKNKSTLPNPLAPMANAMVHRGPDDDGFFAVDALGKTTTWKKDQPAPNHAEDLRLGLAFRRLSILDLSEQGAQPMRSANGRYVMCFNGEIYNYLELKKQFGLRCKSTSDSEVLLELFASQGLSCLKHLNGIFAFAIYDLKEGRLYLARDPFGVKPLYYFNDDNGIYFASEIRSLLKARVTKPVVRKELLARYLMNNWITDPDTLFEGIYKLEPGHFLKIESDFTFDKQCYWDLKFITTDNKSLASWTDQFEDCFKQVVDRQMRSDVPVAFFLSGGIDSSLLAVKALSVQKEPPTTYTVGFRWTNQDENNLDLECARLLKEQFPFNYNEIILEPSVVNLLPRVVNSLEEPIADPAAICSFLICEAASERFKVLVSGQGADELFGGYPVFKAGLLARDAQRIPAPLRNFFYSASKKIPYTWGNRRIQTFHRAKKFLSALAFPWPEPFMYLRSAMGDFPIETLIHSDLLPIQSPPFSRQLEHFGKTAGWDTLEQLLYLDCKTYLPSLNLTYTDKTSMAHSVEARVPFLDLDLAALVAELPHRFKMTLTQSKILLKKVADRHLPPEVVHRKKAGFGLPLKDWLLSDLQPRVYFGPNRSNAGSPNTETRRPTTAPKFTR
jgi:asparagine synthase (glutamine-hydrolysing)